MSYHRNMSSPAYSSENSSCANSPYCDGLSSHQQYVRVNAERIKENDMLKIKVCELEMTVRNLEGIVSDLEVSAANNRRDIDQLLSKLTPTVDTETALIQDAKLKAFYAKTAAEKAAAEKAAADEAARLEADKAAVIEKAVVEKAAADELEAAAKTAFEQAEARKVEDRRSAAEAAKKRATITVEDCRSDGILARIVEVNYIVEDKEDFPPLDSGNWSSVARKAPAPTPAVRTAPAASAAPTAPTASTAPASRTRPEEWLQLKKVLPHSSVTDFKGVSPNSAIATHIWKELQTNISDNITDGNYSGIKLDDDHVLIVSKFATDRQLKPIFPYVGKNFRGVTPKSGLKFIQKAILKSGVYDKIRFYDTDENKTLFILCKDPEANHRYLINMVNTGENFFTKNFEY